LKKGWVALEFSGSEKTKKAHRPSKKYFLKNLLFFIFFIFWNKIRVYIIYTPVYICTYALLCFKLYNILRSEGLGKQLGYVGLGVLVIRWVFMTVGIYDSGA
jgi:hypothetical protein